MFHSLAKSVLTLGFAGLLFVSASADAGVYRLPPLARHHAQVATRRHEIRMHHREFRVEHRHERCAHLRRDLREIRREHNGPRHHGWM